jgi:hypothetical protein
MLNSPQPETCHLLILARLLELYLLRGIFQGLRISLYMTKM